MDLLRGRIKIGILWLFSVGLFFTSPAVADEIKVMTGEWQPFVSMELENYGFTSAIVHSACMAVNMKPIFQFAPWSRCEAGVKHGKVFAAFPYTKTEPRADFALFSKPIAKSRTVFFYSRKKLGSFDFIALKDLHSFLVGGVRGYYYIPRLKAAGLSMDYSEDEDNAFKKLYYGRVDMVPVNELVGWRIVNRLFPDQTDFFATTKTALDESELRLMVSKVYPDAEKLLERFNKGMDIIIANGTYSRIILKYRIPPGTVVSTEQ